MFTRRLLCVWVGWRGGELELPTHVFFRDPHRAGLNASLSRSAKRCTQSWTDSAFPLFHCALEEHDVAMINENAFVREGFLESPPFIRSAECCSSASVDLFYSELHRESGWEILPCWLELLDPLVNLLITSREKTRSRTKWILQIEEPETSDLFSWAANEKSKRNCLRIATHSFV